MSTTNDSRQATWPGSPTNSATQNPSFAKAILGEVFRGRDLSLASEPGFVDRGPNERPCRLGDVAGQVVANAGRKALSHWLDRAAQAETGEERQDALATAERIAKRMGIPLADFIFGRAA